MAKKNETSENLVEPVETVTAPVKKDNTLSIVAISVAGLALVSSLFTVGAATATPYEHKERGGDRQQEQMMLQNGQTQDSGSTTQTTPNDGQHREREHMGEQTQDGSITQTSPQSGKMMNQNQMPMNGMTGGSN